jgi:uroporphyrinogen-III synthase
MDSAKTVALLKSPSQDAAKDPYVSALEDIHLVANCIAVLGFSFMNLDELWSCLCEPRKYSGLILTSPRAVQSVAKAIELAGSDESAKWEQLRSEWCEKPSYVIGEATRAAAEELRLTTRGADSGSAELLVPYIIEDIKVNAEPLLFPSGNLRREVIPKHMKEQGIGWHSITTYETTAHPDIHSKLKEKYSQTQPDFMVFYSPSGVNFTFPILKELNYDMSEIKCIAIGPTTSEALEKTLRCAPAAVALKPTPGHLKTAIKSILES